jgi:hypothetical protein
MPPRKKPVQLDLVEQANALKAAPGRCEEASTLSGKKYIPCNAPAVAIVGWKGRSDAPIRMCAMCEDHNIKNRGGYRVGVFEAASAPSEKTSPLVGHNSELTDDALIAENFKLEDHVKAESEKFAAFLKPFKERIAEIEGILRARLLERKADSTKTDHGTAYFSDLMNTKVEDMGILFDLVAENWDNLGADAKVNIPVGKVREWMDEHDGHPPDGMSISYFKRLNIKRS